MKITPIVCFCSVSTLFSSCQRQRSLRFLFGDCRSFYFRSLMKLTFLVGKGLLCLYDKQNNEWLLVDTKILCKEVSKHQLRNSLRRPIYLNNSFDKTKLSCNILHQSSTARRAETAYGVNEAFSASNSRLAYWSFFAVSYCLIILSGSIRL